MKTVCIIGGGVVGALTARELTKYGGLRVILAEKENDVSCGASKANSGIAHAGFDAFCGTNKAYFNVLGAKMMENLCNDLSVKYRRNGTMVIAFNADEREKLQALLERGKTNGVDGLSIITGDEARKLEPNLSEEVCDALLADTGAIVCPYTLTINAAESASLNGADILTNTEILSIIKEEKFKITTNNGQITADIIINAAGVFAGKIAEMVNDGFFQILPRRGEYMLFDRAMGETVQRTIFQIPDKHYGKGVLVTPTADGNLLIGPSADDLPLDEAENTTTTVERQAYILKAAQRSVPHITAKNLITSFSGVRPVSDNDDFIIGESKTVKNFYNAAGMQSPGLTAAPAVAAKLANDIAVKENLSKNEKFISVLPKHKNISELTKDELRALIAQNPVYGNIICRCETVSEGEILDAIKRGAVDIDGVKRRTRAGMGRCQGGFCMPRVLEILAREKNTAIENITKKGGNSRILT